MEELTRRLKSIPGGRILDIGTGHGGFLKYLTDTMASFESALGIDTDEERIMKAREQSGEPLRFEIGDGAATVFDSDSFDTVAISHSLHHLNNPAAVLREMMRLLKPGGLFIVCEVFQDPATDRPNAQRHIHHFWAEVDRAEGKTHNETFTREQIRQLTNPLPLADREEFDYSDDFEPAQMAEATKQMLDHTRSVVEMLREGGGNTSLVRRGEELVEIIEASGLTDEMALCVMGRKES